ncbi:TIGR00725 family protein [Isoptericola sp. b441]|uniref:TIGR00725 family protein n=1 Tax=Actinotalea lenta TaxID=3064654 RepID=A0ABT9D7E2_9CELL|nr:MULTISPECIES: TIGR00725 family protein [unclassified Isoptericola]MDO8106013.1 TIGR00725 family protein [Isoptericola sp. b441]MDO8122268.1 TIGR00725 family protein [Isoptericola sp. b490]
MAYVGISGPSAADAAEVADAVEVARWAAAHGHVVLSGGLSGVMAAAADGAAQAGGVSVGLLPGSTREGAAAGLTVAIPTGLGEMRNALLVRASDVLVCVGGSWGTLSELALAVRTGVPVVALRTWLPRGEGVRVPGRVLEVGSAAEVCEVLGDHLSRSTP